MTKVSQQRDMTHPPISVLVSATQSELDTSHQQWRNYLTNLNQAYLSMWKYWTSSIYVKKIVSRISKTDTINVLIINIIMKQQILLKLWSTSNQAKDGLGNRSNKILLLFINHELYCYSNSLSNSKEYIS